MATTKEYFEMMKENLALADGIRYYPMMGEYVVYCRDKVIGDICDDRLLVKITPASAELLPDALRTPPYPGAKDMLQVESDDPLFLKQLLEAIADQLPAPKKRNKTKSSGTKQR